MQSHDQSHSQHPRSPEEHLLAVHKALGAREVVDVDIEQAVGCRLARSVNARVDSPSFDNSQMDGYALANHHLGGGDFEVGETIAAGVDPSVLYPQGIGAEIVPVMTGAMVPAGTAAVVPVERCQPEHFVEAGQGTVEVLAVEAGQFVRLQGSDIEAGQSLFSAGQVVNPRTVGAAALQGISTVSVHRRSRVVLCTGGDEIGRSGVATIPDANAPMLRALCLQFHIDVAGHVRTSDDPEDFQHRLNAAIDEHHPTAVVTSGGISHGKFEVVRNVLESQGGWFGHVSQQPGGPQGLSEYRGVPVISLPGNPVSTAVSFRLFVAPVLGECPEPVSMVAGERFASLAGRDRFAHARATRRDGQQVALAVGGAGSHLLSQFVPANLLVRIPAGQDVSEGEQVKAYLL